MPDWFNTLALARAFGWTVEQVEAMPRVWRERARVYLTAEAGRKK